MAETDLHRDEMFDVITMLEDHFADRPRVYVSGNILLYYEEGNPRKHVSPDALVALDVPKRPHREYYLIWKEMKAPDLVIEITSKTTRGEDQNKKFMIYRDILRIPEYIQFDPRSEYLKPPLQGFRLVGDDYVRIEPIEGRLPSQILGLHFKRDGQKLRMFEPTTGRWLLTRLERRVAAERLADEQSRRADEQSQRAEASEAEQRHLAEENERLRREIEALRRG